MSSLSTFELLPATFSSQCCTKQNFIKSTLTWTIENFSICPVKQGIDDYTISSAEFSVNSNNEKMWCLHIYPYGFEQKDFVSIILEYLPLNGPNLQAQYSIWILDVKQERKMKRSSQLYTFCCDSSTDCVIDEFIRRDFLLDEANGLLPDDKLTLYCEIIAFTGSVNTSSIEIEVPGSHLSEDFEKLFENMAFTDVILSTNGHELSAHKNILSARSPVFAAMFKHEMKEAKRNRVEVIDVNHEVLKEMLRFMYSEKAPRIRDMADDLLAAANKYELNRLKLMCEEALRSDLTVENVSSVLAFTDMHNASELETHAVLFIVDHAEDVMDTDGWKTVILPQPHLINKVCRALEKKPASLEEKNGL